MAQEINERAGMTLVEWSVCDSCGNTFPHNPRMSLDRCMACRLAVAKNKRKRRRTALKHATTGATLNQGGSIVDTSQADLGDLYRVVLLEEDGIEFKIVLHKTDARQDRDDGRWTAEAERVFDEFKAKNPGKPIAQLPRQIPEN